MTITINGSGTITGLSAGGLPDATVQQADLAANVAGNGPAFSAYRSTTQSVSNATWTKLACDTKEFDTATAYDNTTNYRFQPTVAGYYQVSIGIGFTTGSAAGYIGFYKNGAAWKMSNFYMGNGQGAPCSALVYLNGTTDYVEGYFYVSGAATAVNGGAQYSWYQGTLVRAA